VSAHELTDKTIDPRYVQVRKKEAARIIGVSLAEFDVLRRTDEKCPKGYKHGEGRNSPVTFRLSDIYEYSELRMKRAKVA